MRRTIRLARWTLLAGLALAPGLVWSVAPVSGQDANPDSTIATTDARAFAFGTQLVVSDGPANLRAAAGTQSAVLTELADGDLVAVEAGPVPEDDFTWYQVKTVDGLSGWIAAEFFAEAGGGPALLVGDKAKVNTELVNLRRDPGLAGDIVGLLGEGDEVTVTEGPNQVDGLTWYAIKTEGGDSGWLVGVYLSRPGSAGPVAFPKDSFVFVNGEVVNLRAEASTEAEIVKELTDGSVATVTGDPVTADDHDWYPVTVGVAEDSLEGWIAGDLLSGGIALDADAKVVDGPLNLRDDTSIDNEVLVQLDTGDKVTVVNGPLVVEDVAWFEVQAGDDNGFVAGRYLEPER